MANNNNCLLKNTIFCSAFLDEFQKFDYGKEKNMEIYGTPKLPLYNLANVQANIHMMYGTDDKSTPAIVSFFSRWAVSIMF